MRERIHFLRSRADEDKGKKFVFGGAGKQAGQRRRAERGLDTLSVAPS